MKKCDKDDFMPFSIYFKTDTLVKINTDKYFCKINFNKKLRIFDGNISSFCH